MHIDKAISRSDSFCTKHPALGRDKARPILILFLLIFLIPNVSAVAITNITQLTYGIDIGYGDPAWSPDGKKIVYVTGSDNNYSIWVMNANGGNQVKLTSGTVPYRTPRWSPDGSKIVFE